MESEVYFISNSNFINISSLNNDCSIAEDVVKNENIVQKLIDYCFNLITISLELSSKEIIFLLANLSDFLSNDCYKLQEDLISNSIEQIINESFLDYLVSKIKNFDIILNFLIHFFYLLNLICYVYII